MASRVNVKFVVILSVSLVALAAAAGGAFVYVQKASGPRLIRLGDQAMVKGDYKAADVHYSKAVNKERTNVEWLTKWREAREKRVPESRTVFESEYSLYVHGILRQLAVVQQTNVEAHREYLDALYQQLASLGGNREGWQHLITETETSLEYMEPEAPGSLRRFRGLAVASMLASRIEVSPDRIRQAIEDLGATLAADPKDVRAGQELASLHLQLAERARAEDKGADVEAEKRAARGVMERTVASNPGSPAAQVAMLALEASMAAQAGADVRGTEALRAREAALAALRPRLAEVAEMLRGAETESIDSGLLFRFFGLAVAIDPRGGLATATALAEHCVAARPDDGEMLLAAAQFHMFGGKHEEAMAEYERVEKLPDPTVGLAGLKLFALRRIAMLSRADAAVSAAIVAGEGPEREKLLDRAKAIRASLTQHVPEQSPELAFIDSKLLFLGGDYRGAQRKLDPLLRTNTLTHMRAIEANRIMADIGQRLQPPQPGLTREHLVKAIDLQPMAIDLRMNLAALENQMGNQQAAVAQYRRVLELSPEHEEAQRLLAISLARQDQGQVDDPVVAKMIEVEKLLKGDRKQLGDEAAAIAALEASLEPLAYDNRLVSWLVSLKVGNSDAEGALAVLRAALATRPDDEVLRALEGRVKAAGSVEGVLALVEASEGSAVDKAISKYRVYLSFGKEQEAAAVLAEAVRTAPEDPRVMELRFLAALKAGDTAEAERIVQRAVATDADRAEGDTFRARLMLHQGNTRDAVMMLERATERGNANAAIFRLLGTGYMQLGRGPEAISSMKRALELNPNDTEILKAAIGVMAQLGDMQAALAAARGSDAVRRDPALRNAWLVLEAQAGNTQVVREMREQILARTPDDAENGAALAELYISDRRWEDARALIDRLRAGGDSLRLVGIDAGWHAAKGDWVKGRQLFIDHIMKLRDEKKLAVEPFAAMAQYLARQGQTALAIEALQNAVPLQDAKTLPVDQSLADMFLMAGRNAEAEETLRKLVQANVQDPGMQIRKRLIESMLRQGKHSEVEQEFLALAERADADPELMCLRAENLRQQGDYRGARDVLDRTVARYQQDPLAYYRRARLLLSEETPLMPDVMADLSSAIRVRPGYLPALWTRASLSMAQDRRSEAIGDLRAALDANPGNEQLLRETIRVLVVDGRAKEAVAIAESALKTRPTDARLLASIADVFGKEGHWAEASTFYKRVWEQTRSESEAGRYVAALLDTTPPRTAEAEAVLLSPDLDVAKSANLLMTRAALRMKQNKPDQARADAFAALQATGNPELTLAWADQLRRIFPAEGAAMQLVSTLSPTPGLEPWIQMAKATILVESQATKAEALALLRGVLASGAPAAAKLTAVRMLSTYLAQDKNWQEALDVTRSGLELAPDDLMLTNNAAFFMAEGLNQGAAAIPLAEKAAAAAPGQGVIQETLAVVYWIAGEKAKAIGAMERALRASASEADRLKWTIRLGEWKLDAGDRAGAERAMRMVREALIDSPSLADSVKEPVEAFRQKLGAS